MLAVGGEHDGEPAWRDSMKPQRSTTASSTESLTLNVPVTAHQSVARASSSTLRPRRCSWRR